MSVVVDLEPQVEAVLKNRADSIGFRLDEYAANILSRHAERESEYQKTMEPLWKAFEESGVTEEELDALVEKARQEIWDEKHGGADKQ